MAKRRTNPHKLRRVQSLEELFLQGETPEQTKARHDAEDAAFLGTFSKMLDEIEEERRVENSRWRAGPSPRGPRHAPVKRR